MAKSPETTFYSLENCMSQNGRELPLIVRVRKGFCGESANQLVQPGEVLIIYKVERKKKILARDNRRRELCLPTTCNWKVEITTETSKREFDKLSDIPSPYFRILQDIPSFGCVAGDTLFCTQELPHQSKARTLRCRLLSSKQRVYITFPTNLKGKFQALPNYRLLSVDQVLHEFSLPVNARLVPKGHPTNCSEQVTQALRTLGNVQIVREIEEETIFAILPYSQNCVVMFPNALGVLVKQFMTRREFMCLCGPQFQQLVTAIEKDKSLRNTLHADRICFRNEQVTWYSLDALQFPPFCFEKIERTPVATESVVVMTKQRELLTGEQISDASIQVETDAFSSKDIRSWINTEDKAPPLPAKMTLKVVNYQITSKKEQVHNIETSRESETPSEMIGKQEVDNVHGDESLVIRRAMNGKSKIEASRSFRSLPRQRRSTRMQCADANFSEIKEDVFSASARQRDVNANSAASSGVDSTVVRRVTLTSHFQSKQPSFHVPYNPQGQDLSIVSRMNTTRNTKYNEYTTSKNSASPKERPPQEESSRNRRMQSDNLAANTDTNSEEHRKEVNMSECIESSLEQNLRAEDSEEGYSREFSDVNIQDEQDEGPTPKELPSGETTETTTAECTRQNGNAEASAENVYVKGDNVKKRLFHSLTRKPRWRFRQDTSKPGKKEKEHVKKERSDAVRIPPRHAASCEDLLFSSPKDDDFECLENIKTFLETKDRLTKALVKINHLEIKLTSKPTDSEDKVPANTMKLPGSSDSSEDEETEIIPGKAISRRPAHKTCESSTSSESPDLEYEVMSPCCGAQLDNVPFESHRKEHCARRDTEGVEMGVEFCHKACFCSRSPDLKMSVLQGDLSESAAKQELKRAILEMEWSDEEWEALTEIVARKISHRKRPNIPYVNLPPFGSPPVDQSVVDRSGIPTGNIGKRMPPYVNLDQEHGIDDQRAKQVYLDDMQRLANRSHGKRPVPTPRGGGSST